MPEKRQGAAIFLSASGRVVVSRPAQWKGEQAATVSTSYGGSGGAARSDWVASSALLTGCGRGAGAVRNGGHEKIPRAGCVEQGWQNDLACHCGRRGIRPSGEPGRGRAAFKRQDGAGLCACADRSVRSAAFSRRQKCVRLFVGGRAGSAGCPVWAQAVVSIPFTGSQDRWN